jgi:uncharacterized protein YjlB
MKRRKAFEAPLVKTAGRRHGATASTILISISRPHEMFAIATGSATLTLAGPGGRTIRVKAADALILPTGTGAALRERSLVVVAYPKGRHRHLRGADERLCPHLAPTLSRAAQRPRLNIVAGGHASR